MKLHVSTASSWLKCPASAHVSNDKTQSKKAKEGTDKHLLVEQGVEGVDEDVDFCIHYLEDAEDLFAINSETYKELKCKTELEGGIILSGRVDAVVVNEDYVEIIDFKFGWKEVEARNNPQLLLGACLALRELRHNFSTAVNVTILQPSRGVVDSYSLEEGELELFFQSAKEAAVKALTEPNTFVPGLHCYSCNRKGDCLALKNYLDSICSQREAQCIDDASIAKILDHKGLINGWLEAVEEEAVKRLHQGRRIPGFNLGLSRTNRVWVDQELVLSFLLGKGVDRGSIMEEKIKSPAQVEKIVKDKSIKKELSILITQPEGRKVLRREKIDLSDFKEVLENA